MSEFGRGKACSTSIADDQTRLCLWHRTRSLTAIESRGQTHTSHLLATPRDCSTVQCGRLAKRTKCQKFVRAHASSKLPPPPYTTPALQHYIYAGYNRYNLESAICVFSSLGDRLWEQSTDFDILYYDFSRSGKTEFQKFRIMYYGMKLARKDVRENFFNFLLESSFSD